MSLTGGLSAIAGKKIKLHQKQNVKLFIQPALNQFTKKLAFGACS
ncbi:hypothetical protein GGR60_003983 [Xanthomonas arboricola]|nr:hypothetical protein [Xanthomonas euroxanthea]